jgi:hypothetical protein
MSAVRRAKLALAVVSLALASLAGGCGHTQRVGSDRTLSVGLTEYHLNPQSVRVSAGPLTVLAHNYGRLTHNLVITLKGQSVGATKPIGPGQSAVLTLALAPGTYLMASTILSDQSLGEYGTLKVSS